MSKLIVFVFLILHSFCFAQNLEFSFKVFNINGVNGSVENTDLNVKQDYFYKVKDLTIGLRGRYLGKKKSYFDLEYAFQIGHSQVLAADENLHKIDVQVKPQPIYRILSGVGQYFKIHKLRFSPGLHLGIVHAEQSEVILKRTFSQNTLLSKESISYPEVFNFVFGPRLGIDYQISNRFYFGVEVEYFLTVGTISKSLSIVTYHYNADGSLNDTSTFISDYNQTIIELNNISLAWSLTYQIL